MWIISRQNIAYAHVHALKVATKLSVESVIQMCKPSIPLLSSVKWNCTEIGLLVCANTSRAC